MSYIPTNIDLKFVLTKAGKEAALRDGYLSIFKYFSLHDTGVTYTLDVQPSNFKDLNGGHTTSTNISSCTNIVINK